MKLTFASPQQRAFFLSPPNGVDGFYGGFASGKSTALCLKLLFIADKFPGAQIALVRRTASQLKKTTLSTLLSWLPSDRIKRFNEQSGVIDLANGSRIYLLHLDSEESLGVLKSLELTAAGVDQAEECSADAIDLLETRIGRWKNVTIPAELLKDWKYFDKAGSPVAPKWLLLTFNCPGWDSYLYQRFAPESPEREKWAARGYRLFRSSSRDNPFLGTANLNTLLSREEEFIKQYVDAKVWGAVEGNIVTIPESSMIDPDANSGVIKNIMSTMNLHRSLDHGETAPTCVVWFGVDKDENLWAFREYYVPNQLVSAHRQAIFELSKSDGQPDTPSYRTNLADPSIFAVSRGRTVNSGPRWSVASEWGDTKIMPRETAIFWQAADNNEEMTRSRMKEYLHVDPTHRHPITGELGAPRLYFIIKTPTYPNGCFEILKDIRAQRRVVIGEGSDGKRIFSEERDETVRDHGWDAVKYFVSSRSSPASGPPELRKPSALFQDGGRLIMTVPKMSEQMSPRNRRSEWRSPIGSY